MSTHVLQDALDALKHEFDVACRKAVGESQTETFRHLNQVLRRFRQYRNEAEWVQVLIDGVAAFAEQVAVFSVDNSIVRLRSQLNLNLPPNFSFRLPQARAFASACELKDPVTALRTPGEVTARLSDNRPEERAHLFPVMNDDRVVAVLFAAGSPADSSAGPEVDALEIMCGIAGSVLERKSNLGLHSQIDAITPSAVVMATGAGQQASGYRTLPAAKATVPLSGATLLSARSMTVRKLAGQNLPAWTELAYEQRQLHLRAQRYARVTVAEMQLNRPEACKAGREQSDIYLYLKHEIDKARENYHKQFMTVPSMVDYLHLELIQTAGEGDERKLGADYPGELL